MANMLSRVLAMSARVESSYASGTPTDTSFNSGLLLFRNTTPVALDTQVVDLQELRSSMTKTGDAVGRQLYRITPGLVLMGHANSISTFRLDPIFRMCGLAGSTSGSTRTYVFRSTGFESGVVDIAENDVSTSAISYGLKGVYGNTVIAGSAGQPVTVDPTLTGIYTAPTLVSTVSATLPTNTSETMKGDGLVITDGGGAFSTAKCKSFSLDLGWPVNEDLDFNATNALAGLILGRRNPTFQLTVGLDSSRYTQWVADITAGTKHTITFTHGSAAGKYCKFTIKGQLTDLPQGDDVDLRTVQLTYNLAAATEEDELKLEFF